MLFNYELKYKTCHLGFLKVACSFVILLLLRTMDIFNVWDSERIVCINDVIYFWEVSLAQLGVAFLSCHLN